MESTKRNREINWDRREKGLLLEGVTKHKQLIENKSKTNITNSQKEDAWKAVQAHLESFGYSREITRLKEQWRRMKMHAKKRVRQFKACQDQPDGGPLPVQPSEMEYNIVNLVPHELIDDNSLDNGDMEEMVECTPDQVASTLISPTIATTYEMGPISPPPNFASCSESPPRRRSPCRRFSTPVSKLKKSRMEMFRFKERMLELNNEKLMAHSEMKIKVEEMKLKNEELIRKQIEFQIKAEEIKLKTEEIRLKIEEAKLQQALNNL